jgi:hypothetical protein
MNVMNVQKFYHGPMLVKIAMLLIVYAALFSSSAGAADEARSTAKIDVRSLAGRWLRPDGGYILELRDIKKDGSLNASYFNPRPIKVYLAKWNRKKGTINVFVELRDINYPGSKYELTYDPVSDILKGIYYQAVEKQSYDIEFVRMK